MAKATNRKLAGSLAVSLSLVLGACGGMGTENRTLYSVHQPVVERTNFTLDASAGGDGLAVSEQQRIADWFGVQYHPEASPGPQDSFYLFEKFVGMLAS